MIKPQDLAFLFVLGIILCLKNWRLAVVAGLLMLFLAYLLFKFMILFTAERLTWYTAALFMLVVFILNREIHENRH